MLPMCTRVLTMVNMLPLPPLMMPTPAGRDVARWFDPVLGFDHVDKETILYTWVKGFDAAAAARAGYRSV